MANEKNTVKDLEKSILKNMLFADIAIAILSALWMDEPMPFLLGLIFGSAISALNFKELAITLTKAVNMPPEKAQSFTTRKYFLRYIVTAVVIFVSITAPYINIIGTIIGLVMIKFIILATNLFNDKKFYKNILKRKEDETNGR
ncbi:ATP synthase subunit I [Fusibacter ferrireducens]|uniref:ATP synthase subunit I n=1 Tax=Fusibacter ferrireducens TaxID=2785058 RepID=A0ABR9ZX64_9FIRM|nr:ATP synthase subunit I [Fusibacter ferrireducens]MBF4694546.1 ATP synthase subunit I [Fusibacter ferrireducens]